MASVGLEIAVVDVRIDTVLLDNEHIRTQLQDAVELQRGQLGEGRDTDLCVHGKTAVTDVCAAEAPWMRPIASSGAMPLSRLTGSDSA